MDFVVGGEMVCEILSKGMIFVMLLGFGYTFPEKSNGITNTCRYAARM